MSTDPSPLDPAFAYSAEVTFAVMPEWLLDAEVSDRAVRLYGILARHADRAGRAWPSRTTLAERCRCSVKSVDRALAELESVGALTVAGRWSDARGGQTSNLYVLRVTRPMPQPAEDTDPPGHPCPSPLVTGDAPPASPVTHEREPVEVTTPQPPASGGRAAGGQDCPKHRAEPGANCRACGTTPRQIEAVRRREAREARRTQAQQELAAERARQEATRVSADELPPDVLALLDRVRRRPRSFENAP